MIIKTPTTMTYEQLLNLMGNHCDGLIYTADGDEFIIYSPHSNNQENADMWYEDSVIVLDRDANEHEIEYKDIVDVRF